jgi:plasmid maintenance system antidote protein VapI
VGLYYDIHNMNGCEHKSPITDLLRRTIAKSGIPYNQLERATGVKRASIIRFLRGDQSMRPDLAERLMVHFGLEVRKRK